MAEAVPVLMYHSIAPEIEGWAYSYLSIDPVVFEGHLAALKRSGFAAVSLGEFFDYVNARRRLPPRAVVLTFDDGYLDNWVFAFPILRKHGFRGTVFVSTDFIDRRPGVRPNLDDVWQDRSTQADLEWCGFLNADEMKHMIVSDVMDIQGHCKTHTWYFTAPDIIDFHHPGDGYPWLAWNARPERKPLYLEEDQSGFVGLGSPVYGHARAVIARRYFPDPKIEEALAEYVERRGGVGFFDQPGWRDELGRVAAGLSGETGRARYESPEEQNTRLREEIVLSKQEIEAITGRSVDFLCWPGGAYNDRAVEMAREAGYSAWTLSSRDPDPRRNQPGEDPRWIRRTAVVPWWSYRGRRVCGVDGDLLVGILKAYKGFAFAGMRVKWLKARRLLGSYWGGV
jgi:peptidoglycan/xylan/chitin deacetylase (PgdA/CDA1 family)